MYPKNELKSICYPFVWIGMASPKPYFQRDSRIYNSSLFIPAIIQLTIIFFEGYIVFLYPEEFLFPKSKVGTFTDIVQVYGLLFVGIIQIIENLLKGDLEQSINRSIEAFDREIFAKHTCQNQHICLFYRQRSLKPFLISRIFYFIILLLAIDSAVIVTIPDEDKFWRQSICVREFTANMIRFGLVYTVCHLHWVNVG